MLDISIQPMQLLTLVGYALLVLAFIKVKNKYFRVAVVAAAVVLVFVNPVRFDQKGMTEIERHGNAAQFDKPIEKVEVDQATFAERQRLEMEALKNDSEDMQDEIHN